MRFKGTGVSGRRVDDDLRELDLLDRLVLPRGRKSRLMLSSLEIASIPTPFS